MRIPREWIGPIAKRIVDTLVKDELIIEDVDHALMLRTIEEVIFEELSVEDRINDEVRRMLTSYDNDISRGRLDYRRLFDLTKQKIVKERNIVL